MPEGGGPVVVRSRLDVPAPAVWRHATSLDGINHELQPLLRMTAPLQVRSLDDPRRIALGRRICRSWILLFGVLPFDYDDVVLVDLDPGRRFVERSTMLSQRVWRHERTVEPVGDHACVVTDRVDFRPRIGAATPLVRRVVSLLFRHRHRRLRARFGDAGCLDGR